MKKLLLVAVLLLLSAPAFGKGAELNIKGVKVGTLYKTVVAQLGKPVKIERSTNECAGGKDITMHYDGLRLYLLEDVNGAILVSAPSLSRPPNGSPRQASRLA
jgi:hypothetical protein